MLRNGGQYLSNDTDWSSRRRFQATSLRTSNAAFLPHSFLFVLPSPCLLYCRSFLFHSLFHTFSTLFHSKFLLLLLCPTCLTDLSFLLGEENTICQRNTYINHSCSAVLTYATRASGCGAQGSFQQRRERLARATTRRPLDTTSFVHTPGIPILNKTVGLSTVAAATCLKPPLQPNVLRRVPKD